MMTATQAMQVFEMVAEDLGDQVHGVVQIHAPDMVVRALAEQHGARLTTIHSSDIADECFDIAELYRGGLRLCLIGPYRKTAAAEAQHGVTP